MSSRSEARRLPVPPTVAGASAVSALPLLSEVSAVSTASDTHRRAVPTVTAAASSRSLAVALIGALILTLSVTAVQAGEVAAEKPVPVPKEPSTAGTYQVRCWQHGRLLFEESAVALPDNAVSGLRLSGTDRRRQPLMVTDTGNATCLIRSAVAPRRP
jgi:hypothetical protein